eukprot:14083-Heterococcus_DN1.PRE.2
MPHGGACSGVLKFNGSQMFVDELEYSSDMCKLCRATHAVSHVSCTGYTAIMLAARNQNDTSTLTISKEQNCHCYASIKLLHE